VREFVNFNFANQLSKDDKSNQQVDDLLYPISNHAYSWWRYL